MVKPTTKRKDNSSIKKRLAAALCMLLVSLIMLITSTYAWFTLSTAPEVSNIATTVTGNGSLELALMPQTGLFAEISAGSGTSGADFGGNAEMIKANTSWGNIVDLSSDFYGLQNVALYPSVLNLNEGALADDFATAPLMTPTFGFDGRAEALEKNTLLANWDKDGAKFAAIAADAAKYGVRAIAVPSADGAELSTYGYVVDFAVRTNAVKDDGTNAKLLLSAAAQRIYNGSTNEDTMGAGSTMTFSNVQSVPNYEKLMGAIRITFVKNYGVTDATLTPEYIGTAKLVNVALDDAGMNATADVRFCGEDGAALADQSMTELEKNTATQISAIVWLDGSNITNADVSSVADLSGKLNIQLATDVTLYPADNTALNQK